jgi:hypothetical protein
MGNNVRKDPLANIIFGMANNFTASESGLPYSPETGRMPSVHRLSTQLADSWHAAITLSALLEHCTWRVSAALSFRVFDPFHTDWIE